MTREQILQRIDSLELQKQKLLKNFEAIVKRNDNDLKKQERENAILDIINYFNKEIETLKKQID